MAYIGKSPTGTGVRSRFYYTQTSGGGTSISGTDDNSKTLTFTDGEYIDVYLNGVLLVAGTDYNTNTANTISGLAALANGDVVEVVVYDIFTVADTVSASQGGTFNAAITANQVNADNIRIDGNTISSTDTNGDITLDPDGTGDVIVASGNLGVGEASPNNKLIVNGAVGINAAASAAISEGLLIDYSTNLARFLTYDSSTGSEIAFYTQPSGGSTAERLRIDSGGVVGIGLVPSGTEKLQVSGQIKASQDGSASAPAFVLNDGDTGLFRPSNNCIGFTTEGSEKVRIDNGGKLCVARTSGGGNVNVQAASNNFFIELYNQSGSSVGSITTNGSSTSYNTSSDYRLKENVADMTGAIDRVKALAPKRFNFIADADTTVDGFLAHEAQTVVPEAISGTHNEVDEDGNAVMQGIDQSKLVPLLTGALKEAIAKIETLETKVAALEAAE